MAYIDVSQNADYLIHGLARCPSNTPSVAEAQLQQKRKVIHKLIVTIG